MDRDIQLLEHILNHYAEMLEELEMVNDCFEEFERNKVVNKAIKMDVLQMGENTTRLSEESKSMITRRDSKGMIDYRNQIAHGYVVVKDIFLWNTIHEDIPRFIEQIRMIQEQKNKEK